MAHPPTRLVLRAASILAAAALLAVAGARFASAGAAAFQGTAYDDLEPAPELSLLDPSGARVSIGDLRGEAILLFFGFTRCPEACPLTLSRLGRVLESMGPRADQVRVLLVTVDPQHDTPERLREYTARFTPRAIGLTGDSAALAQAYRGYGVYAAAGHSHGETLTHSTVVYGIDREGRLRVIIPQDASEALLRNDLEALLAL